jgi:xanthine dehydrogenase accessory factor
LPTADAVAELASPLGFVVRRTGSAGPEGAVAALVSSHGGDEVGAVRAALDAGVGFVGLVCSRRRGEALLAELDLSEADRRRVFPHVGLDIGARTAPEIALSILAAVVRAIRVDGLTAAPTAADERAAPRQAVDPVCGMTVTITEDTPHAQVGGTDHWFCNPGCRETFLLAQPA